MINRDEFPQGILQRFALMYINAKIQYPVERVAVVAATVASNPRPQLATEYLVHPCRFRKFGVDFPVCCG